MYVTTLTASGKPLGIAPHRLLEVNDAEGDGAGLADRGLLPACIPQKQ
jgi:hypothetical protein